jgi:hypothetical protein
MNLIDHLRARRHERRRISLVQAVDELPYALRVAMLAGVRDVPVIAGAYVDADRRVCPLLAAHRLGERHGARRFVGAWDRFCAATHGRPRLCTGEQVGTLVALLETSLRRDIEQAVAGDDAGRPVPRSPRRARGADAGPRARPTAAADLDRHPQAPEAAGACAAGGEAVGSPASAGAGPVSRKPCPGS